MLPSLGSMNTFAEVTAKITQLLQHEMQTAEPIIQYLYNDNGHTCYTHPCGRHLEGYFYTVFLPMVCIQPSLLWSLSLVYSLPGVHLLLQRSPSTLVEQQPSFGNQPQHPSLGNSDFFADFASLSLPSLLYGTKETWPELSQRLKVTFIWHFSSTLVVGKAGQIPYQL